MTISIPFYVREALDKSLNASPNNSIVVTQLNEQLYSARWNLQHNVMELDQMWEVDYETQPAK